jgi:uncharacterized protein YbjT (DUF2867 family)
MGASISDIRLLLKVKKLPRCANPRRVFVTGGTGYIGSHLIPALLERGHHVRALVRTESKGIMPPAGCELVSGNALDGNSYRNLVRPSNTFVHLVGVAHPSPSKGAEFRSVDLVAAREAIGVASELGLEHFVYLSVAHPAPVMKAYIAVRSECEAMIGECGLRATIVRPWYVLGPGHKWPYALVPMYKLMELLPFTRRGAQRLGLVTLEEIVFALVHAVESTATGVRQMDVPDIRAAGKAIAREDALALREKPVRQGF